MRICIFSSIILKMQCRLVRHLIMTHSVDTLSQIDRLTDYNVLQNDTDAHLIQKVILSRLPHIHATLLFVPDDLSNADLAMILRSYEWKTS